VTLLNSPDHFSTVNLGALPPVLPQAQRTLYGSAQCSGIGLHSGQETILRLLPAEVDTGIRFVRTDLPAGRNLIQARYDQVSDTKLCTVLSNDMGASIGTVEHLLAALRSMDIDNAVVEVNGPEVPIMDGSAAPFVLLIEIAGIVEQDAPRRWLEILKPVTVIHNGKRAELLPADEANFAVTIDFGHPAIGRQEFSATIASDDFKTNICRARTFGFADDVAELRRVGLARGGSLHNAIVLDVDRVLNQDGLRYRDEFARHKLLDAIGDLFLAGAPIRGSFVGECSGHALNNALLHKLFADDTAYRYVTRPALTAVASAA
jgi:UDP-3-O-[3-hydroxymyristoyl] N-acetylglucosamine deacetylase